MVAPRRGLERGSDFLTNGQLINSVRENVNTVALETLCWGPFLRSLHSAPRSTARLCVAGLPPASPPGLPLLQAQHPPLMSCGGLRPLPTAPTRRTSCSRDACFNESRPADLALRAERAHCEAWRGGACPHGAAGQSRSQAFRMARPHEGSVREARGGPGGCMGVVG